MDCKDYSRELFTLVRDNRNLRTIVITGDDLECDPGFRELLHVIAENPAIMRAHLRFCISREISHFVGLLDQAKVKEIDVCFSPRNEQEAVVVSSQLGRSEVL